MVVKNHEHAVGWEGGGREGEEGGEMGESARRPVRRRCACSWRKRRAGRAEAEARSAAAKGEDAGVGRGRGARARRDADAMARGSGARDVPRFYFEFACGVSAFQVICADTGAHRQVIDLRHLSH